MPKKTLYYILLVAFGFVVIIFGLPRLLNLITGLFGFTLPRWSIMLFIAAGFYFWGEICLYVKKKYDVDI